MPTERTTIIKNGTVVIGQLVSKQDVLIHGEMIAEIGDFSGASADTIVDADGLLVLPGGVDTHVHFNDEFMNTLSLHDYYRGTLAAAFGGTTTVIDFSNQKPGGTLMETLLEKHREAEGRALVDWGVHPVITQPTPETLDEIPLVIKEGAPTIKCYMTYRQEGIMTEPEDLGRICARLAEAGGMLMVHAEDNDTIEENIPHFIEHGLTEPIYHARSKPVECETAAIARAIDIARESGCRLFVVHLASDEGLELIARARDEGADVLAETCTHYLLFSEEQLKREDGIKWICSPPLRERRVQEKLWRGLKDGGIHMVSSDDAAFSWEAKLLGADRFDLCPNGIPGIEPRMALLYSEGVAKGRISLPRFVELTATAPARIFGLAPGKGSIAPGADADIVLLDPAVTWNMNAGTLHMATDWSAYENIEVTGRIVKVFSRGELIIDGDTCLAKRGRGLYCFRELDLSTPESA